MLLIVTKDRKQMSVFSLQLKLFVHIKFVTHIWSLANSRYQEVNFQ